MKFHKVCMKCNETKHRACFTVGRRICRDCYKQKYLKLNVSDNKDISKIPKQFMKNCAYCDTKFSIKKVYKIYCNRKCYILHRWYQQTKPLAASCHPDKLAILKSGGPCTSCYHKEKRTEAILKEIKGEPKRVPFKGKACPCCAKWFKKVNHPEQIYCSKKCAMKIRRKKANDKRRKKNQTTASSRKNRTGQAA